MISARKATVSGIYLAVENHGKFLNRRKYPICKIIDTNSKTCPQAYSYLQEQKYKIYQKEVRRLTYIEGSKV